jgi:hypothetical protein
VDFAVGHVGDELGRAPRVGDVHLQPFAREEALFLRYPVRQVEAAAEGAKADLMRLLRGSERSSKRHQQDDERECKLHAVLPGAL